MDEKREEIYERIPWETMENRGRDRQWLVLGVAAAVVAGALGYSFVSNRSVAPVAADPNPIGTAPAVEQAPAVLPPVTLLPPVAVPSTAPALVAEADLYAVLPDRLMAAATAHAEWFAVEYLTMDGSEENREVLRGLLSVDIPLPAAEEGTLVFVEWVKAIAVDEIGPTRFSVDVLSKYLVARDGGDYQRTPPELLTVEIEVGTGDPQVVGAPRIAPFATSPATAAGLVGVSPALLAVIEQTYPGSEVIGGLPLADGSWDVVVMSSANGVIRPETVRFGP